jgi:hypothetical protein
MCLQVALLVVSFKLNWNLDMVCTPLQVVILLHLAWGIGHVAHQWIELTKEGLPPTLQLLPGYGTGVKKSTQHMQEQKKRCNERCHILQAHCKLIWRVLWIVSDPQILLCSSKLTWHKEVVSTICYLFGFWA